MAAGDGLIVMTPTSIDVTGTSGSINADGGVDFTAVTALSLNGVFTSEYDNYCVFIRCDASANDLGVSVRLRVSGSDASGTNYARQYLAATGSGTQADRFTGQTGFAFPIGSVENGEMIHIYGPCLAQPTAFRSVDSSSYFSGNISILDNAGTHSLSTSYDGISFILASGNITGAVTVFGYEE